MQELGIRGYPALAYETQTLTGLFLTKGRIRRFLKKL
jgi:hypothetical protein